MTSMKAIFSLRAAILFCLVTAVAQGQIQSSFFGMGVTASSDPPKVSYGTMSHPPLAWTAGAVAAAAGRSEASITRRNRV